MNDTLRWLPKSTWPGPLNMAADEVMLEAAVAGVASLRVYTWDPPTVSLGYFQKHDERLADLRLAAMPWVRRPTGGGAIIHDQDLTYAIALPKAWLGGLAAACWHDRIHHALAQLMNRQQVPAALASGERPRPTDLGYLCFAVPQPGDVLLNGVKIIGGAQRLRAGALMQHGSIQFAPLRERGDELVRELARALGWQIRAEDWTAAEKSRIEELARDKYGTDAWNKKR
jgi:lipoate-protein ligase A